MASALPSYFAEDDSTPIRRQRGRITSALFASGGVLAWVAIVAVPGWQVAAFWPLSILAAIAILVGAVTYVYAELLSALFNVIIAAGSTVLIAFAQAVVGAGEPAGVALGMLYIWIAAAASLYFTKLAVVLLFGVAVVAQAVVFLLFDVAAWLPQLLFTAGTYAVTATVVTMLARQLRELSVTDSLTGLKNRRGMERLLGREMTVATRRGTDLCVVLLDLDRFKQLNDTRGHQVGDRVLKDAAESWQASLRPGDVLARIGGDEFLAVLPGCDPDQAYVISERLLRDTPELLTCSIGVAGFAAGDSADALLRRADRAMYRAKDGGGRQIALFAL